MAAISNCSEDDVKTICNGINQFNFENTSRIIDEKNCGKIELVVKNSEGVVQGGVLAHLGYFGGLMITILWVNPEFRNQGIGTQLMKAIEKQAKERGAITSFLDTFSFQAKDFYLRSGYEVFGTAKNFPKGHDWIYMSKEL